MQDSDLVFCDEKGVLSGMKSVWKLVLIYESVQEKKPPKKGHSEAWIFKANEKMAGGTVGILFCWFYLV